MNRAGKKMEFQSNFVTVMCLEGKTRTTAKKKSLKILLKVNVERTVETWISQLRPEDSGSHFVL